VETTIEFLTKTGSAIDCHSETIASTWPRFKARLEDEGRSRRTIGGYGDIMKRLSDEVKNRPLRELGADPSIMEREIERIRELLKHKKRGGQAMATAVARFVGTLFSFAQTRDPHLLGGSMTGARHRGSNGRVMASPIERICWTRMCVCGEQSFMPSDRREPISHRVDK
jgi:hypothetical protein